MLHLDDEQMWNAMGLAFSQPGGESGQAILDRTTAVRLFQGGISRNSMFSVQLARRGFTGPKNFLSGPRGYYHLYSGDKCDAEVLVGDLGKRFELRKTLFKSYPSCGGTISSTDAILHLMKSADLDPESVARIDIQVSPQFYRLVGSDFEPGTKPTITAQFSIPYCVANALLRKSSSLIHFTEPYVLHPQIMELVKKIHVAPDPDSPVWESCMRANMKVTTKNGNVYEEIVDIPSGFPGNPLKAEEHENRFREVVSYAGEVSDERREKIVSTVSELEKLEDVRDLIRLISRKG
jgi:2-methylcitrate dehydratase PrpD